MGHYPNADFSPAPNGGVFFGTAREFLSSALRAGAETADYLQVGGCIVQCWATFLAFVPAGEFEQPSFDEWIGFGGQLPNQLCSIVPKLLIQHDATPRIRTPGYLRDRATIITIDRYNRRPHQRCHAGSETQRYQATVS